ncbi:MAG TPA: M20/M25/M40 family metallo-hydrolase, partial [Firmicutes bacterium]|nr:M20/M25/M40 family metallo-hydrolase [Bacillota bacterium]
TPRTLDTKRVTLLGKGRHKLQGIMNVIEKPFWLQSPEDRRREITTDDFFVDLCLPADEVKKKVEVGDPIVWHGPFFLAGDCAVSKAMDDRVGVYVMLEAMKKVKNNTHDIYAVGSVQEEVGLRGAITSAYNIDPDIGIACDIMGALDVPGCAEQDAITFLGKGIALGVKDGHTIADPALVNEFRKIATRHKIPFQIEVSPMGGTDAGAMQRAKAGSRAITLSIPTRYGHSVNETVHKTDVEAGIELLAKYLSQ